MSGRWKIYKSGNRSWWAKCPADSEKFDWSNDFGRGMCHCRKFRKWTLARNYVFKRMGAT